MSKRMNELDAQDDLCDGAGEEDGVWGRGDLRIGLRK